MSENNVKWHPYPQEKPKEDKNFREWRKNMNEYDPVNEGANE